VSSTISLVLPEVGAARRVCPPVLFVRPIETDPTLPSATAAAVPPLSPSRLALGSTYSVPCPAGAAARGNERGAGARGCSNIFGRLTEQRQQQCRGAGDHPGAEGPVQGQDVQPRRKAHPGRGSLLHGTFFCIGLLRHPVRSVLSRIAPPSAPR